MRLGRLCPRWSAICRAERPASSRRVATVRRKVCDVAQGTAEVAAGVVRIAEETLRAGEEHRRVRRRGQVSQAPAYEVECLRWQRDGAPVGGGLGDVLDEQAEEWVAGHRAGDGERARIDLEVGWADSAGLADAQAGAEHEGDEVGQVLAERGGVGGQPGPKLVRLREGERSRTAAGVPRPPASRCLANRVGDQQPMPDGEADSGVLIA